MNDLTGKLLIASPVIHDPWFGGKVVYLNRHEQFGSEGFILNGPVIGKIALGSKETFKEIPKTEEEIRKQIKEGAIDAVSIYMGGPLETGIFMIHGYKEYISKPLPKDVFAFSQYQDPISFDEEKSEEKVILENTLMDGAYMGSPKTMAHILTEGKLQEGRFRFFAGRAAWAPGQLQAEIDSGAWTVKEAGIEELFDSGVASRKYRSTARSAFNNFSLN